MRAAPVVVLAAVLALAGCAVPHSLADTPPSGVPTPLETRSFGDMGEHFLVVRSGNEELRLASLERPIDDPGLPTDHPDVRGDDLFVFVRPAGWPLWAEQFTGAPYECGERTYEPEVAELGGGWWRVSPIGPAATYTLHLSAGSGPGLPPGGETGSMEALLTVETTKNRPTPAPFASLDLMVVPGEESTVTLDISHLAASPSEATATATVTGDGAPVTVQLQSGEFACPPGGSAFLVARMDAAAAAALGDGPLQYDITLDLDGTSRHATGTIDDGNTPVELRFTPALP